MACAVSLAGCASGSETKTSKRVAFSEHQKAQDAIRRADLREIRLVRSTNTIGPPTVKATCPKTRPPGARYKVRCTAQLALPLLGAILDEPWTVRGTGNKLTAKPADQYQIRAFYEADKAFGCTSEAVAALQQGGGLDATNALAPCLE